MDSPQNSLWKINVPCQDLSLPSPPETEAQTAVSGYGAATSHSRRAATPGQPESCEVRLVLLLGHDTDMQPLALRPSAL